MENICTPTDKLKVCDFNKTDAPDRNLDKVGQVIVPLRFPSLKLWYCAVLQITNTKQYFHKYESIMIRNFYDQRLTSILNKK